VLVRILVFVGVVAGALALLSGLEYYALPLSQRPFSPLHELYAPTGLIGHGFGIVGSLMVLSGVVLYSGRKRIPFLSRVGKLRGWLQFHIFLCLLGPFLILLHTTFKFGGLVAISFWSMALVVGSGVFGRYVYVWIPKTMNGRFLAAEDVREQLRSLIRMVELQTGLPAERVLAILKPETAQRSHTDGPADRRDGGRSTEGVRDRRVDRREVVDRRRASRAGMSLAGAILSTMKYRLTGRRRRARFTRELEAAGVREPLRSRVVAQFEEETRIEQSLRTLQPFQRGFRYWHAFHLPLAVVMFLVLFVHVGVAVAFGYTWVF
jgi:hypothetical protein